MLSDQIHDHFRPRDLSRYRVPGIWRPSLKIVKSRVWVDVTKEKWGPNRVSPAQNRNGVSDISNPYSALAVPL